MLEIHLKLFQKYVMISSKKFKINKFFWYRKGQITQKGGTSASNDLLHQHHQCRQHHHPTAVLLLLRYIKFGWYKYDSGLGIRNHFQWTLNDPIDLPSLVFIFTRKTVDVLYFVKVTEKETGFENMKDPQEHFSMLIYNNTREIAWSSHNHQMLMIKHSIPSILPAIAA